MRKNLLLIALGAAGALGGKQLIGSTPSLASGRLDLVNLQLTRTESANLLDGGTGPAWVGRACAYEFAEGSTSAHVAEPCWPVQLDFQQLGPVGVAVLDQRK